MKQKTLAPFNPSYGGEPLPSAGLDGAYEKLDWAARTLWEIKEMQLTGIELPFDWKPQIISLCSATNFVAKQVRNAKEELQQARWQTIDSAPLGKEMFVVKAIDVTGFSSGKYTSDPYCVWQEKEGEFARWPHYFAPTHWMKLPKQFINF